MKAGLTLRVETAISALGPEWDALFATGKDVGTTRAWFQATIDAALPPSASPSLLALSDESGPLALMPMLAGPGRRWGSLTTPYTCLYQPLLRDDLREGDASLRSLGLYCRKWPVTRLEALDPDWPGLSLVRAAFEQAGLITRSFSHFGNWHESVTPGDWAAYLAARPGALRETIRRRTRASTRSGDRFTLARAGDDLAIALAAYEDVYSRSWKNPEPYERFNATLVHLLAGAGVLRIGVLWRGETPIAAQYWSVVGGTATILKLAYDGKFRTASPGTVLTAATIRELMEADQVQELDFGRGDDPYKRDWVGSRRPRIGLLAMNVRTVTGGRILLAHDAGTIFRRARTIIRAGRNITSASET